MGTAMLDDEKNNRENGPLTRSILSSTYINFLFGAGVNSVALPQLYGFNKTIEQINVRQLKRRSWQSLNIFTQ